MSEKTKFNNIPASACTLVVGKFALGDNGENAKSAPIRMTARSGKPIEHPYWGRIVHDLSGMKLHKNRIPIDYVHDPKEIIGYLNHFDYSSGDLVASGAIVPWKQNDRATEVMHKQREGVPYEASINFGGDGIKVEEVPEGFVTQVNGYELEGPAVVVREWPLRGVAVCPYGADMHTESSMFSANKKYAASVFTTDTQKHEGENMSDQLEQQVAEEPLETTETEMDAEQTIEEVDAPEAQPEAVEDAETEPENEPEEEPQAEPQAELSRTEFIAIVDEFGADIAATVVKEGGNYQAALKLAYDNAKAKIAELKDEIKSLSQSSVGNPAPVVAQHENKKPLFKTGQ